MDITTSTAVPPAREAVTFTGVRYHHLDNLRALALIAGILLHVGIAYSALFHELWPMSDTLASRAMDNILWFIHCFRMPLFFLIAGFFAHYLVQKRGLKGFLKNRAMRIALPFVIFWPLLTAAIMGVMIYAATSMGVDTPIAQIIRQAVSDPDSMNGQKPPISTTHLWFIYYLTQFCLIAALCYKVFPRAERLYRWLANPIVLFVGLPLASALILVTKFIPHPAPESFIPEPWGLAFFGLFFFAGWAYFANPKLFSRHYTLWPYITASAVVAYVVFVSQMPEPMTMAEAMVMMDQPIALTSAQWLRAIATGFLAWHMSFLCLLAGYRFLNQSNRVLRYIADGSYWVYIIHLPIVFYLQAVFHTVHLPILIEFLIMSMMTLGIGYLSYELLVKRTPIGWLLNGRKSAAK